MGAATGRRPAEPMAFAAAIGSIDGFYLRLAELPGRPPAS
jgi:hypothetical protein